MDVSSETLGLTYVIGFCSFTAMSSDLEPLTIVKMLNTLFTYFDHLTEEYNIEKVLSHSLPRVSSDSYSQTHAKTDNNNRRRIRSLFNTFSIRGQQSRGNIYMSCGVADASVCGASVEYVADCLGNCGEAAEDEDWDTYWWVSRLRQEVVGRLGSND